MSHLLSANESRECHRTHPHLNWTREGCQPRALMPAHSSLTLTLPCCFNF